MNAPMTRQQFVDHRENRSIEAFERWQGWRDEHAAREIERRLLKKKRRADILDLLTIALCLPIAIYFLSVLIHGA